MKYTTKEALPATNGYGFCLCTESCNRSTIAIEKMDDEMKNRIFLQYQAGMAPTVKEAIKNAKQIQGMYMQMDTAHPKSSMMHFEKIGNSIYWRLRR